MKRMTVAVCAAALLFGLATRTVASADELAAPVKVFEAGELTLGGYTVVKRIWVDTWRSAFWISTHDNAGAAIAALTAETAGLGADGVINLHCLNDAGGRGGGYFCYGFAIKLK